MMAGERHRTLRQRLLSGGIWAFSAKAGTGFLTIALTALVTRLLDPQSVGVLFLSFSIVIMLSVVLRLGLDQLGIKLIGEAISSGEEARVVDIVKINILSVCLLSIASSILIYTFFIDFARWIFPDDIYNDPYFRMLFSIWVVIVPLQLLLAELFRALRRIDYASIFSGGTVFGGFSAGLITGIILMIVHNMGFSLYLADVLAIIIVVSSILLVIEIILIWRILIPMSRNTDANERSVWSEYIKKSFPFLMVALCTFSILHMDTIILGIYRPEEEVAVYSAASRLVKFVSLSLIVAYEVAAPFIVQLNSSGEYKKLERMLRCVATAAALPSVILLSAFVIFPESILVFLYGDYYGGGVIPLVILSIGQMVNVWTGLSGYTLNMLGYQTLNMYISVIITLVALSLMTLLVDEYGVLAVSVIIASAWIIKNILTLLLVKYHAGIWTHAGILNFFSTSNSSVSRRGKY